jgi:phosphatidate cytidylyltransferase
LLVTRIITGVIFGGALTAAVLFLPTPIFAALFAALWLAGAWEWAGLARLASRERGIYAAVTAVAMAAAYALGAAATTPVLAIALVWWVVAFGALLSYPHKFPMSIVAAAGFAVLLPSWLLLGALHAAAPHGRGLAMLVLAIVWSADVGAYAAGRWLGRVKLAPAVSPGKTWEGVGGGLLLAAVVASGAAAVLGLPVGAMAALGIATALASVVGDLAVSMFKRNVGLKDSGALLPGHGGVMDRIDSLTAAIPVFTLGTNLMGLVG